MLGSDAFLEQEPEELEQFLLQLARRDQAPAEARERALRNVAAAALGVGVFSGAALYGSPTSLAKATAWLVAKWLVAGFGAGLLTITVTQVVAQRVANAPSQAATSSESRSAPKAAVPAVAPRRVSAVSSESEAAGLPEVEQGSAPVASVASETRAAGSRGPANVAASGAAPSTVTRLASSAEPNSLTRELSFLEHARGALAQHAALEALHALDEYRTRFPNGSLQVEAAALRVEAVGQSGNRALAQQLAESFLTNFPSSPLAARVRAAADALGSDVHKP
ncbi:MAG TPA: hypothetical protein VNW92_02205 [Polyangiaceae bacterium]|jgi:hypothetical protein|nr:hypothetical protein [Polyangiaceae bacterium]